jgi:hypothetical protein
MLIVPFMGSIFPDQSAMVPLLPLGHSSVPAHPTGFFQRGLALIPNIPIMCDFYSLMKANQAQLARNRKQLVSALSDVRQHSMRASHSGDYRTVARLTVEAARINSAISDVDVAELSAL